MNYEHKGVAVTFNAERATFSAEMSGKRLYAPSLYAIKKKIDAEKAVAFEPFSALIQTGRYDRDLAIALARDLATALAAVDDDNGAFLLRVTVVGVRKENSRPYRQEYVIESGRAFRNILPDTPEAIAAWLAHRAVMKRKEDAIKQYDAQIVESHKAVPWQAPEDQK